MKKTLTTLALLVVAIPLLGQIGISIGQTGTNPFAKFGYDKHLLYSMSKGEFEEFHDETDIVEIGNVFFNTRTNQIVGFIDNEEENAAFSSATSALQRDPMAAKYYWITPYAFCANNPIKFIDPTGEDILIWYKDDNNNWQTWSFTGSNQDQAPRNQFVSDFMTAYNYNVENGGGDNLKNAAISTDFTVNVVGTTEHSERKDMDTGKPQLESFVRWNPTEGLETSKGTLSPATILEHEMDHGVQYQTKTEQYLKDKDVNKSSDPHFSNKEEKRVITGSEYKTGVANGELQPIPKERGKNDSNYRGHKNNTFIRVVSPISNKKKPLESIQY